MAYYFNGVRCDTLAELVALQDRESNLVRKAEPPMALPIAMTDDEAIRVALAGEPRYPPRATHPEDSHDDERDYRESLRRWEHAKAQVRGLTRRLATGSTRPIGDGDSD